MTGLKNAGEICGLRKPARGIDIRICGTRLRLQSLGHMMFLLHHQQVVNCFFQGAVWRLGATGTNAQRVQSDSTLQFSDWPMLII